MRISRAGGVVVLALLLGACTSPPQSTGKWIQGVNHASFEYGSAVWGQAPCGGAGPFGLSELKRIKSEWNSNMVRIPLSSNSWLGDYDATHGTHFGHEGNVCPGYDDQVRQLALEGEAAKVKLLFVLAYVDPCSTIVANPAGAGYDLPGQDEAVHFWQTFASDSAIINNRYAWLDTYGEPHDVSWEQWYAGGRITQVADSKRAGCTYAAAGMAELVTVIRTAAPERTIVISGNNWAGDITHLDNYSFKEGNLYFGVHIYPGPQSSNQAGWPTFFGNMDRYPVIATEFGTHDCSSEWVDALMIYLRAHAKGMLAWGYNRGNCKGPRLLDESGQVNAYGANIQTFFQQISDVAYD